MSHQQSHHSNSQPKYYAAPPVIEGNVAIGLEKFSDMLPEIKLLHEAHFNETETEYLDEQFNPNYPSYVELEKEGRFVCFTVRLDGQMVAYLQYYVFRFQYAQHVLSAREDALFVHPLCRGRKIARHLIAYAEDVLKQLGCKYVGMTSKGPVGAPDVGPFLVADGYKPVAMYFVKNLES